MPLLSVEEALARLLGGVAALRGEATPLAAAPGRVLAADLVALRTQPPFPASAMDGYAVRAAEATSGSRLRVVGESRAGRRFEQGVAAGEAVRIFTGAPVPDGADAILIQENAERHGDHVVVLEPLSSGRFIRPAGLDFTGGDVLLAKGRLLEARAVSLAAAAGHATIQVSRRPRVAVLSTGDELVPPGAEPGPDQIISSNGIGLTALARAAGAEAVDLGIASDTMEDIQAAVRRASGFDVLVVIGGASVGDHDLAQPALTEMGMRLDFWRIAMRPGKPLMVGTIGNTRVLGLPGNPVSALVCGTVFLAPLIRALLGSQAGPDLTTLPLGTDLPANDARQDYLRARIVTLAGRSVAMPVAKQDSSMLGHLAQADGLIIRPPHAAATVAGEPVTILKFG